MKTATLKTARTARLPKSTTLPEAKGAVRIKSILVPTDFSQASAKALSYAAALAEQFGAKLTLLFVIEPIGMPDFMRSFPLMMENDEMTSTCKSKLMKFAHKNAIKPALLENALVRRGRPFAEITDAARTLKVDLIVISTNGYSGINLAIMGSVTERVVRHAPCPVLVVREREHDFVGA